MYATVVEVVMMLLLRNKNGKKLERYKRILRRDPGQILAAKHRPVIDRRQISFTAYSNLGYFSWSGTIIRFAALTRIMKLENWMQERKKRESIPG